MRKLKKEEIEERIGGKRNGIYRSKRNPQNLRKRGGQSHLGIRLDRALKEVISRKYPEYKKDPAKQILLSYCIQGTYHAYLSNPQADTETFVRTIENIVRCLRPLL